jgi:methionine sulfoxide reductase heme-binding subunit
MIKYLTWMKTLVFVLALVPALLLGYHLFFGDLGPDPVARMLHDTGGWALKLLLVTLMVTPLRRITGWHLLIRFRRMLGLYAFFYASLHLSVYLFLDLGAFWSQLLTDIIKRPYITVGFTAWLLLIPLAATSTQSMMRRLGKNWQPLHRLNYVIAVLGVLHYIWLVKSDWREPAIYAVVLGALLIARLKPIEKLISRRT